jgi:hypothetical protein
LTFLPSTERGKERLTPWHRDGLTCFDYWLYGEIVKLTVNRFTLSLLERALAGNGVDWERGGVGERESFERFDEIGLVVSARGDVFDS